MAYGRLNRLMPSLFATALFIIAYLIASYHSISVTSFSISDTNPASYIIVVMLMLFVFAVFTLKEKLEIVKSFRNAAYALGILLLYVLALAYFKLQFSFLFQTYRIDALLFPLMLLSLVVCLFGFEGAKKLRFMIVYSIFASPLLLMPLLKLSNAFTGANAYTVFGVLKAIGVPVYKNGLVISSASGNAITIASTCADIGAFIALLMFLLPVAYVYYGPIKRKVLWLAAGMALIFVLNIARMSAIALIWAYYGLSAAVNTVHLFIGQVLFDITIIAMILLAPKFALYLNKGPRSARETGPNKRQDAEAFSGKTHIGRSQYLQGALALLIAIAIFALTLPLGQYYYSGPFEFYNSTSSVSNSSIISSYVPIAENTRLNATSVYASGKTEVFGLYAAKKANSSTDSYLMLNASSGIAVPRINTSGLGRIIFSGSLVNRQGLRIDAFVVNNSNDTFDVNYVSVPTLIYGKYLVEDLEFISLINDTNVPSCSASIGAVNAFYSYVNNALHGDFRRYDYGIMCGAEFAASS